MSDDYHHWEPGEAEEAQRQYESYPDGKDKQMSEGNGCHICTAFVCEVCGRSSMIHHEDARDYDTLQRRPRNWNVWGKHVICNECNNKEPVE